MTAPDTETPVAEAAAGASPASAPLPVSPTAPPTASPPASSWPADAADDDAWARSLRPRWPGGHTEEAGPAPAAQPPVATPFPADEPLYSPDAWAPTRPMDMSEAGLAALAASRAAVGTSAPAEAAPNRLPMVIKSLHPLERRSAWRVVPQYVGLAAPALLAAALVMTVLMSQQITRTVAAFRQANAQQVVAPLAVTRQPMARPSAQRIATVMANNHPGVEISVHSSGSALVVAIPTADLYPQWLHAMQGLQAFQKNLMWESQSLCVGKCDGFAARAEVKGYRQDIQEKGAAQP